MKRAIGVSILSGLLVLWFMVYAVVKGFLATLILFGISFGVVGLIWLAAWLIESD